MELFSIRIQRTFQLVSTPLKTGCNKFQMESVKMKKATKTVAFRQLAIYCNIVDNQLLTDAVFNNV